jgi:hypothetical protein
VPLADGAAVRTVTFAVTVLLLPVPSFATKKTFLMALVSGFAFWSWYRTVRRTCW